MKPAVVCAFFLFAFATGAAQQTTTGPRFDAASVRENTTGDSEGSMGERPAGYVATNTPLRLLIVRAYRLRTFQVIGGPNWIDSARFDINARAPAGTAPADVFVMLQNLLADRFELRAHTELREQSIYALVTSRDDGRLGSQLKPSAATCSQEAKENPCSMGGSFVGSRGMLKGVGQPLSQLATHLSTGVDRIVVDRTGLKGLFDFELAWAGGGFRASQASPSDDGPSVFTAVQEQLGLRLEPSIGPVEVLVIDSVATPQPD